VDAAETIAERLNAGDRSALARMISWAENGDERFPAALAEIFPAVGRAWRVGITGPPGAGKSTLTNALTSLLRERDRTVGVLAVDPSSPFSGGALLGDRIRMEERTTDPGVYIRSMASRGSHGGLARAATDSCDVMDAFGFDRILVETVGVGQAEYEVVGATDTVVVVLCPGAGDSIQAMKAGLLEVADVLVVNKSDLPGADRLLMDLEEAVTTRTIRRDGTDAGWKVPVIPVCASNGDGVSDLTDAIAAHREHLSSADLDSIRRLKRVAQVRSVVGERLDEVLFGEGDWAAHVEARLAAESTPYDVAAAVVTSILAGDSAMSDALGDGNR